MSFYSELAATALALIKRFGQSLPIKRVTNTIDAVAGSAGTSEASGAIFGVVLPAKNTGNQAFNGMLDNSVIEALVQGKGRYIIAAAATAPFEPSTDDVLTFEGELWRVLGATPLSPAGVPLIYYMGAVRV